MIKLISSYEPFLTDQLIQNTSQKLEVSPIYFDASERTFNLEDIYFESISLDIFNPKKLIIIKNALFLTTKSKLSEKDEVTMNQILHQDNDDVTLFFIVSDLKFDSKKKIIKKLKEVGEFIGFEASDTKNIKQELNKQLKNNKINLKMNVIEHLSSYVHSYQQINQAIEKLSLYDDEITIDVIDDLIVDESELVIFDLSNALIEKRMHDALKIYDELKRRRIDVGGIINILSKKVRQIYQALVFKGLGYQPNEVATELSISPQYAWVLMNRLNNLLSIKECTECLYELALYDQKMKYYMLDKQLEFELWMVNYGRKYGKS